MQPVIDCIFLNKHNNKLFRFIIFRIIFKRFCTLVGSKQNEQGTENQLDIKRKRIEVLSL